MISGWKNAGWPIVRIGEIGRLHGGGTPSRKRQEFFRGTIPWITGQAIPESHVTVLTAARDYVTEEAIQESATRVVPPGSVLVTTRVSVGKTAVAGCPICFSQDITALLIHSPHIARPAYVAHYLRARRGVLLQKNQGSTIAGITRDSLALEEIPLPSSSEQMRIVEILQEAEEIQRLRMEADAKAAQLVPAIFYTIFGDLYSGKPPFATQPLSSIGELDRGRSRHRPRDEPSLYGGPYPFLQTGDVAQANGWITTYTQTYSEKGLEQSRLWPKGTLAITIAANIGSTAILTFDACFPDSVVGFTPGSGISVEYVRWFLLGYQRKLELQAAQGAQKNINLEVLRSIQIPVPPPNLQLKFQAAVQNIREQADLGSAGTGTLSSLRAALSSHAFSGLLTADWREANQKQLALEARQRDAALKEAGAALIRSSRATFQEAPGFIELPTDGVYSDLNREQRALLVTIRQNFASAHQPRYFSVQSLSSSMEGMLRRNHQAIEGHLAILAARGLLIPVSREEQTGDTGEYVFGNAYRLPLRSYEPLLDDKDEPRAGDHTRLRELERLAARLEKGRALT